MNRPSRAHLWTYLRFVLILIAPALLLSAGLTNGADTAPFAERPGWSEDEVPLRALAEKHNLRLGAAMAPRHLDADDRYGEILGREFNALTPENAMKFRNLTREEGIYDFREADRIMAFAQDHDMAVRGHALAWHMQTPDWLTEERFSSNELKDLLREHVNTVLGRYRGRMHAWDVVNEAFNDDGTFRDTIWLRALGPDYISKVFRWAHEADPHALLFYNDYSAEGMNAKSDAVYALAKQLLDDGVPLHGVGLQMHLVLGSSPSPKSIAENMRRLGDLGLKVAVTEMDVRIPTPVTEEKLTAQAETYAEILKIVLAEGACNELTLWGFTDNHSWIPRWFPETDAGLIFDEDFQPKPAYDTLRKVLETFSKERQD